MGGMGSSAGRNETMNSATHRFTITVYNVSKPGTLPTDRLMGAIALSPVAYAVFGGADPMFTVGAAADAGTELIAEDGVQMAKVNMLGSMQGVGTHGAAMQPAGMSPAVEPGESATFTVVAAPGQRLQIETMFVQSNDWFYGFGGGGLALFNGNTPISGDVTSQLVVYDAGTEQDTAPGTGPFQKPVQAPTATNVGPSESVSIRSARERHPNFNIPANASVIRVTIAP